MVIWSFAAHRAFHRICIALDGELIVGMQRTGQSGGGGGGGRRSGRHQWPGRGRGGGRHRGGRSSSRGRYSGNAWPSSGGGGGGSNNSGRTYGPPDVIEEIGTRTDRTIAVAVEGCCHGQITAIYDRLRQHTSENDSKIDLLLCCGDFQSLRTPADFHSLAVPPKYRDLGTFHQYYSQQWTAPVLTIFIGGNHEASQPLSELYYGGWVAPNMYYLGAAGVVRYRGIRIGGISGIYKSHDHVHSRFEVPPYDNSTLRSIYHYRNVEVYRLLCLAAGNRDMPSDAAPSPRLGVMLSHDWPQGIEQYGDTDGLIRRKPFFRQEIADNSLGSPPVAQLLHALQPWYWFSAHLHVKFRATVRHDVPLAHGTTQSTHAPNMPKPRATSLIPSQAIRSPEKPPKDKEPSDVNDTTGVPSEACNAGENTSSNEESLETTTTFVAPESAQITACSTLPDLTDLMTQFLSLDKCLPRRQYLSIVHVPVDENQAMDEVANLEYDLEWLAILRKTHYLSQAPHKRRVSVPDRVEHAVSVADMEWLRMKFPNATIPHNFVATVPPHVPATTGESSTLPPPLPRMGNPQTDQLLKALQLKHLPNLTIPFDSKKSEHLLVSNADSVACTFEATDENEIDLQSDDVSAVEQSLEITDEVMPSSSSSEVLAVEEIPLDTLSQDASKRPKLVDENVK